MTFDEGLAETPASILAFWFGMSPDDATVAAASRRSRWGGSRTIQKVGNRGKSRGGEPPSLVLFMHSQGNTNAPVIMIAEQEANQNNAAAPADAD